MKPDETPVTWGELREAPRIIPQLSSAVDLYSAAGVAGAVSGDSSKVGEFEGQVRAMAANASAFFGPEAVEGLVGD